MFSFLARKKIVDASPFVRRIIDLTSPNRPRQDDQRIDVRYNRSIPVLLCGWTGAKPDLKSIVIGFTTDLSDRGFGIIVTEPIEHENLLVTLLVDPESVQEPVFLHCHVKKKTGPQLGYYRIGLSLIEALDSKKPSMQRLDELVSEIVSDMYELEEAAAHEGSL